MSTDSRPVTAPSTGSTDALDPAVDRRRGARSIGSVIIWVLLIGFSLLFLYPLVWLLAASLTTD